MNIVRQDCNIRTQNYDCYIGKHIGWELLYTEFEYPTEYDKSQDTVKASLEIIERFPNNPILSPQQGEEGHFRDVFYLNFDGSIRRFFETMGFSPVLSELKKLDNKMLTKIRTSLSPSALNLFDRGLESYMNLNNFNFILTSHHVLLFSGKFSFVKKA
ncbi:MAG: hypothetical protein Q8N88_05245 [Nanoarchaeota archaeon]|nr:hypothetical protein [Nanoarchaeota archaeon]